MLIALCTSSLLLLTVLSTTCSHHIFTYFLSQQWTPTLHPTHWSPEQSWSEHACLYLCVDLWNNLFKIFRRRIAEALLLFENDSINLHSQDQRMLQAVPGNTQLSTFASLIVIKWFLVLIYIFWLLKILRISTYASVSFLRYNKIF